MPSIQHIQLCQPDQLALSAPDHRAARQLREKVLYKEENEMNTKVEFNSGGEDLERFDHVDQR